ncbi:MAG: hypothetical protein Ct9H300mP12_06870 [Acidimicrobiales bacterium]|nr:MAG: hypothetical protein Ct9H300mP12_06870 [Acidimicrobiales bacterium]
MSELPDAKGRSTSEVFPLEGVDRAIIAELQVDGRMSYTDLAPESWAVPGRGSSASHQAD